MAPGLYKNERNAFRPYLLWTFLLFISGAAVVYFIVMPLAMKFFLSMEQTGGQVEIHLQARVSEYLSLIMTLIIGFGIMFQLPVVLSLLAQAGMITAQSLRGFRRYAIVAITAVAGVLSPPDPFSMIAMALPTLLLYEAGICGWTGWRSSASPKRPQPQAARRRAGARLDLSRPAPYSTRNNWNVIPAQAGPSAPADVRRGRIRCGDAAWVPACAGMTSEREAEQPCSTSGGYATTPMRSMRG